MTWSRSDHINVKLSDTGTISVTTGSFTPQNDSLLVAVVSCIAHSSAGNIATANSTVSGGSLTWTKRASINSGALGFSYSHCLELWTAPVGTAGSMTLTFANTLDANGADGSKTAIQIFSYTGYNTGDVVGATITGAALSNPTGALTLSAPPASDSMVVAARSFQPDAASDVTATAGSGWDEIYDNASGAVGFSCLETQQRTASTSDGVVWTDINDQNTAVFGTLGLAVELKAAAGAGEDTPIDAEAGSFTATGQAATFGASMAAGAGSFAHTGQAATLSPKIAVAAGSFEETGVDATFGASVAAEVGAFGLSGQDVAFEATGQDNISMTADVGEFALNGQAVTLPVRMAVGAGAFTHTGVAAILAPKLNAAAGSFLEIGVAAALVPGYQGGMVPLQWNSVVDADGYIIRWGSIQGGPYPNEIDVGDVTDHILAGISSGRWYIVVYAYDSGGESTASNELVANVVGTNNINLTAEAGSFAYTGQAATLRAGMPAATGSYSHTGQAATMRIGMASAVGVLTQTGIAAPLKIAVVCEHGEYTMTGHGALLHLGLTASVSPYNLVGPAVNLFASEVGRIPAETGSFVLGGQSAVLARGMPLEHGIYTLAGEDIAASIGLKLAAGAYDWTGVAAAMDVRLKAERGVFSMTGASIGVTARTRVVLVPKLMQRRY